MTRPPAEPTHSDNFVLNAAAAAAADAVVVVAVLLLVWCCCSVLQLRSTAGRSCHGLLQQQELVIQRVSQEVACSVLLPGLMSDPFSQKAVQRVLSWDHSAAGGAVVAVRAGPGFTTLLYVLDNRLPPQPHPRGTSHWYPCGGCTVRPLLCVSAHKMAHRMVCSCRKAVVWLHD